MSVGDNNALCFYRSIIKKYPIEFNPYRGRYNLLIDTLGITKG